MPENKAGGQAFTVKRADRGTLLFDYHVDGRRVRRLVAVDALTAFLEGRVDADSNLAPGAMPMALDDFATGIYIPFDAKPRLERNAGSFESEEYLVQSLCKLLGRKRLHEIRRPNAEDCKAHWLKKGHVNNSVKKRLNCLRRIMECAVSKGLIRQNPIPPVRGLPVGNRSGIWLRLPEIDRLLACCHRLIAPVTEYQLLTGARITEALDFRQGDIRDGRLYLPTEKRRCPPREAMRDFDIRSLGPRFPRLMERLTPHPKTGFYFYADKGGGAPLSKSYAGHLFREACKAAGFPHLHDHDLRGSFLQHRRPMVPTQDQLICEMGHSDARCLRSYRDSRNRLEPHESIFFTPPETDARTRSGIILPSGAAFPPPTEQDGPRPDPLLH